MSIAQNKTKSSRSKRPVPTPLLWWITSGALVSVLFTITYLIEGAIRPDYNSWKQAISELSLGPGGWVHQISFLVFGAITILAAFAWSRFLNGGAGKTWYPILKGIYGLSLIMTGIFNTLPRPGYPMGIIFVSPSFDEMIHVLFGSLGSIAMIIGYFVLARRFTREANWRGWAAYSIITGLLITIWIPVFLIFGIKDSSIAGLVQRLGPGLDTIWGVLFIIRLWMGAGFGVYQKKDDVPA